MPGHRGRYVVARHTSYQGLGASQGDAKVAPNAIVVKNGPELISKALDEWAYRNNVRLHSTEPGMPIWNAFVESLDGRLRDECLNEHWFTSLADARRAVEDWRIDYNTHRPRFLEYMTPIEYDRKGKHRAVELST